MVSNRQLSLLLPFINLGQEASEDILLQAAALIDLIDLLVDLFVEACLISSIFCWDVYLQEDLLA